ncbi:Protein SYM1 [Porphyridium purpureum]|uniref:Protein SYM1 n=1 Tax=Porphyridium purpureum TaxID=35688 RepID=A0A5J4YU56_PORPP|nr:Protein SYM1 [Porphyridium purpureum]|eukprot:POR9391..scf229_5
MAFSWSVLALARVRPHGHGACMMRPCGMRAQSVKFVRRAARAPNAGAVFFDKVPAYNPYGDDDSSDEEEDEDADSGNGGIGGGKSSGRGKGGDSGGQGGGGDFGGSDSSSPLEKLMAWYAACVRDKPLLTKVSVALVLNMIGDILAQYLTRDSGPSSGRGSFRLNLRRTLEVGLIAAVVIAPNLHGWYLFLNRAIPSGNVVQMVLLDQLVFAPYLNSAFMLALGALNGKKPAQIRRTIKDRLWPTMLMNWQLWPAAQALNFMFVPPDFQVLCVNLTAFVWSVLLSYSAHAA